MSEKTQKLGPTYPRVLPWDASCPPEEEGKFYAAFSWIKGLACGCLVCQRSSGRGNVTGPFDSKEEAQACLDAGKTITEE
jgi:hypothetical protein